MGFRGILVLLVGESSPIKPFLMIDLPEYAINEYCLIPRCREFVQFRWYLWPQVSPVYSPTLELAPEK